MSFTDETISQMMAKADLVLYGRVTEKLYRYIDDGMKWRLAARCDGYSDWNCFEGGHYIGVLHSRDAAKHWVDAL